jgi:tetratricopeptide (TPR) repeat protein
MSKNPEALAAYRRAVEAARNAANIEYVEAELHRARAADPDFAAAYLRELVMYSEQERIDDGARVLFSETLTRRSGLGPHDRALLDAIEPRFRVPQDAAQTRARFDVLARQHDPDFDLYRCFFLQEANDYNGALAACVEARQLDPSLAIAYFGEGWVYDKMQRPVEEEQAFRTCLDRSPQASRCIMQLGLSAGANGRCDEYASLMHQMVLLNPNDPEAYGWDVHGAYAHDFIAGTDFVRTRAAMQANAAHETASEAAWSKLEFESSAFIGEGHLAQASDTYREQLKLTSDEGYVMEANANRIDVLLELGRGEDATALARQWLAEYGALTPTATYDTRIIPLRTLYRSGALSRSRFQEERRAWLQRQMQRSVAPRPSTRWWRAYGEAIKTREDAQDALKALSGDWDPNTRDDTRLLRALVDAYVLAGRSSEAMPFLRKATKSCPNVLHPLIDLQLLERLGTALAPTDPAGACDAYAKVLVHLGHTPGSVSAQRARDGRKALHCDDAPSAR